MVHEAGLQRRILKKQQADLNRIEYYFMIVWRSYLLVIKKGWKNKMGKNQNKLFPALLVSLPLVI